MEGGEAEAGKDLERCQGKLCQKIYKLYYKQYLKRRHAKQSFDLKESISLSLQCRILMNPCGRQCVLGKLLSITRPRAESVIARL